VCLFREHAPVRVRVLVRRCACACVCACLCGRVLLFAPSSRECLPLFCALTHVIHCVNACLCLCLWLCLCLCVYVCVVQPELENIVVVRGVCSASNTGGKSSVDPGLGVVAAATGATVAEYFRAKGQVQIYSIFTYVVFVCWCVCVFACMYACVYTHTHIHTHTHTHTHTRTHRHGVITHIQVYTYDSLGVVVAITSRVDPVNLQVGKESYQRGLCSGTDQSIETNGIVYFHTMGHTMGPNCVCICMHIYK